MYINVIVKNFIIKTVYFIEFVNQNNHYISQTDTISIYNIEQNCNSRHIYIIKVYKTQ